MSLPRSKANLFSTTTLGRGGLLQRKCACGNHASGGECEECQRKKGQLQRRTVDSQIPDVAPPIAHDARDSSEARFQNDSDTSAPTLLPAAPAPQTGKTPPAPKPATKQKLADLFITVRSPAQITDQEIFATNRLDALSSGISFELSQDAKFKQDEFIIGSLRWKAAGSKSDSEREDEDAKFTHSWESETLPQMNPPSYPIMLKVPDTHIYGLSVSLGRDCEAAAKNHRSGFERQKDDWILPSDQCSVIQSSLLAGSSGDDIFSTSNARKKEPRS